MKSCKKRAILVVLLSLGAVLCFGLTSFLKQYELPYETITGVRAIKSRYVNDPYIIALEGYNRITDSFFTRVQAMDNEGNLIDDYSQAYVGQPLNISSGIFEQYQYANKLITPMLEYSQADQRYHFLWNYAYSDHNYLQEAYTLPDSVQSVTHFPTAIGTDFSMIFGTESYLVAGRGVVNGINHSFMLDLNYLNRFISVPQLIYICGIAKIVDGYVVIGQFGTWKGKILLLDNDGNELWEEQFTDAANVDYVPYFTTPLLAKQRFYNDSPVVISYQNKDRVMHVDLYQNQGLQELFSLQLESYIGAVPIAIQDSLVAFAYTQTGTQYISRMDLQGNILWTRELPGVGSFGKNALSIAGFGDEMYYMIGGRMAGGGFYLAKIEAATGRINYDTVSQPEQFEFSCYPNPCHDKLNVSFDLKKAEKIKLELYNIKGQKITEIADLEYPIGKFAVNWTVSNKDGKRLPAGIYLLSVCHGVHRNTLKVFLQ